MSEVLTLRKLAARAYLSHVVIVEQRQLDAKVHLGMLPVSLRLEQVMPCHAVVIGHDLPMLLRPNSYSCTNTRSE